MISIIETALVLILVFGILVIFHEFGHFTAAKLVGIRVEEFAIGFGPKLVRLFKRGDTEYTIHPYPLGGFVKLAGMEPGEEDIPDGYQAQPTWKRALTIFAGPFASFVLAVIVFVGVGVFGGFLDETNPQNRIGSVFPGTEAQRIGLRTGDTVLSIDGNKVTNGGQMIDLIGSKPGKNVTLRIARNNKKMTKTGTPRWMIQYLGAEWSFQKPGQGVVENMRKTSAAEKAGIKIGDEMVSIDGKPITSGGDMVNAIEADKDKTKLVLRRDGKIVRMTVDPTIQQVEFMGVDWSFPGGYASDVSGSAAKTGLETFDRLVSVNGKEIKSGAGLETAIRNAKGEPVEIVVKTPEDETKTVELSPTPKAYASLEASRYNASGKLGFMPEPGRIRMGFVESAGEGLRITGNMAMQLVETLTSSRIKKDVGGPIMIVKMTHQTLQLGPYFIFLMLGSLSMSLAFINLIPIPVLDGGHLAIIAVEAIRRKRLTREQMATVQMIGLAIIVMLVIVVFVSDITKITGGMVPQ